MLIKYIPPNWLIKQCDNVAKDQRKWNVRTHEDGSDDPGDDVALRRFHDVHALAHDEDDRGDQHQARGDAEGQRVARVVAETADILPKNESV